MVVLPTGDGADSLCSQPGNTWIKGQIKSEITCVSGCIFSFFKGKTQEYKRPAVIRGSSDSFVFRSSVPDSHVPCHLAEHLANVSLVFISSTSILCSLNPWPVPPPRQGRPPLATLSLHSSGRQDEDVSQTSSCTTYERTLRSLIVRSRATGKRRRGRSVEECAMRCVKGDGDSNNHASMR